MFLFLDSIKLPFYLKLLKFNPTVLCLLTLTYSCCFLLCFVVLVHELIFGSALSVG